MTANKQDSSYQNTHNVMIIGDIRKAFLDTASVTNRNWKICSQLPDAIEAASDNSLDLIAIVMFGIHSKLNSTIEDLRDKCSARIVLLVQMYEEPIAIRMVSSTYNGRPLVDDYMICPIQAEHFHEFLTGRLFERTAVEYSDMMEQTSWAQVLDQSTETKIRYLEKLATEDDLTGLKNRRYIREFTRQIIEYAKNENARVTLLLFDVDDFKKYNDLYGHCAGDEILKQAAVLMRRCCRAHDVVGRIGGDEFAVVFWDDPSILKTVIQQSKKNERRSIDSDHPNEAMLIARRFVKELEKTPAPIANHHEGELGPKGKGTLTISGGLASFPRDGSTTQQLFEQADKALLEAKRSGKNRIYLVGKPQNQ